MAQGGYRQSARTLVNDSLFRTFFAARPRVPRSSDRAAMAVNRPAGVGGSLRSSPCTGSTARSVGIPAGTGAPSPGAALVPRRDEMGSLSHRIIRRF